MTRSTNEAVLAGDEMDDRDRNPSSGSPGRYSRRPHPDEGNSADQPPRRRSRREESDQPLRSGTDERRSQSERERYRPGRESVPPATREPGRTRPPARDEGESRSWNTDRFRRAGRDTPSDVEDRSSNATRDPYDRLRRVGNRPARRVEVDPYDDPGYVDHGVDDYDDPMAVNERGRIGRPRARVATPGLRQQQVRSVGALVANPSPELRPIVIGALLSAGSLILLSILLLVRGGNLSTWFPTRWNAEGEATVFGTSATAWRLPIFAVFSSVMALGLGWWLREREPFAAQFLAVGVLLIHGLIWISAITLLW